MTDVIRRISDTVNSTYPPDLDPEAWRYRRVGKVFEEAGEVQEAMLGIVGENPRKGVTHGEGDLIHELLDVALAALGAVAHLTSPKSATPLDMLISHALGVEKRLNESVGR